MRTFSEWWVDVDIFGIHQRRQNRMVEEAMSQMRRIHHANFLKDITEMLAINKEFQELLRERIDSLTPKPAERIYVQDPLFIVGARTVEKDGAWKEWVQ